MDKFIGWQMIYGLGECDKHNIIWGRDFNKLWKIIKNNNFCMEYAKDIIELLMICAMIYIHHVSYTNNVIEVHMDNNFDK